MSDEITPMDICRDCLWMNDDNILSLMRPDCPTWMEKIVTDELDFLRNIAGIDMHIITDTDLKRNEALDELVKLSQEMGLYDINASEDPVIPE